jgi:hypothetical protein
MWLDAVPDAPSLRLEYQSCQDADCVHMGVRTFSSFGTCWTCSCRHTVEDDDVAHALGCIRLRGLVQSRHEETAEVLRELLGRLGFSSTEKGDTPGLRPAPPTAPRHAGTFNVTCAPGLATFSPTSCFSIPWLLPTHIPLPAPLAMPLLFGMPTSAGTTLPTTTARDMHSARNLRSKPWGGSVRGHAIPL